MDAARPQTALRDLEPAALAQNHVRDRHAHVVERHFGVAVRRVIVAEHRQHAHDFHARGVARNQNLRLLQMAVGVVRGGLAHEDQDFAARVAHAGRPPLASVDDVFVPVAHDARLDVRGVGRGHGRLGHGEARPDLALQQRLQPRMLLFGRAVARQHFHVAGVRRGTVEHLGGPMHAAHDLGQRRVFEIRQAVAVLAFGQEQVPQPRGFGLVLQLFEDGRNLPAVRPGGELLLERPFVGIYVVVHEPADLGPQVFHFRRKIEIHHGSLLPRFVCVGCACRPREWQGKRECGGRGSLGNPSGGVKGAEELVIVDCGLWIFDWRMRRRPTLEAGGTLAFPEEETGTC